FLSTEIRELEAVATVRHGESRVERDRGFLVACELLQVIDVECMERLRVLLERRERRGGDALQRRALAHVFERLADLRAQLSAQRADRRDETRRRIGDVLKCGQRASGVRLDESDGDEESRAQRPYLAVD